MPRSRGAPEVAAGIAASDPTPGGVGTVTERVVDIDGIPMSALCAEVAEPRAVVVALHGGATTSRYFDLPGRPELSLLRAGAALGYTVLAPDRPGYGASAPFGDEFDDPARRVDACYATVDALLGASPRGAGTFLLAHSAGCDLGARMAADPRGARLLGLELAGTGTVKYADAERLITAMRSLGDRGTIRDLLWYPEHLYPEEVRGGRSLSSRTPRYEATVAVRWPMKFPVLSPDIRIPVRLSHAEHERVWRTDPDTLDAIARGFTSSPRLVWYRQAASGHNMSVGFAAGAYHRSVLAFVEECALATERPSA